MFISSNNNNNNNNNSSISQRFNNKNNNNDSNNNKNNHSFKSKVIGYSIEEGKNKNMSLGQIIHLNSSIIDIDDINNEIENDINGNKLQHSTSNNSIGDNESYVSSKLNDLNLNDQHYHEQEYYSNSNNNNQYHQNNNNNNNTLQYPIEIIEDCIDNDNNNIDSNEQSKPTIRNVNYNFLEVLKPELINYIFLKVGALDMPSLIGVNKQCLKIGMNEKLWLYFVENDFTVDIQEIHQLIRLNGGVRSLYANLFFRKRNSIVKPSSPNPLIKYFLNPISRLPSLFTRREYKVLMYGLDGSGKTTMLYKFARGENVPTKHTNGYNVEVVEYKSCDFICWDVGYEILSTLSSSTSSNSLSSLSNSPIPSLSPSPSSSINNSGNSISSPQQQKPPVWHHYLQDTQAIIFIIDATDRTRLRQVREEFWKMVTDKNVQKIVNGFKKPNQEFCRVKVLIYANKFDQTNSVMTTLEITQALSLFNLPKYITWHVQGCSAISEDGDGLYEGLDWLSSEMTSIQ